MLVVVVVLVVDWGGGGETLMLLSVSFVEHLECLSYSSNCTKEQHYHDYDYFNTPKLFTLLVWLARESFWAKAFTNRLVRVIQLKMILAAIYNSFRMPVITRQHFETNTLGSLTPTNYQCWQVGLPE